MNAIDHVVLPTTTLTLARSRLSGLGFTVAPDARHPFGTGNCCVFFQNRSYLEPITIQDRDAADKAAAEGLYFVKRIKRFMQRQGEGMAMLALSSDDAKAAHEAFAGAGLGAGDTYRFSRMARLPDGSEREVGVVLAFADMPEAPDATVFACQHMAPDALFQAEYLAHANGAIGISRVTAVARNPADFRGFFTAAGATTETASELETKIGAQTIAVLTPDAFRARYDTAPPDPWRGLLFAAVEIAVSDLGSAAEHAGAAGRRDTDRIVVPAAPGLGAVLAFREAGHG